MEKSHWSHETSSKPVVELYAKKISHRICKVTYQNPCLSHPNLQGKMHANHVKTAPSYLQEFKFVASLLQHKSLPTLCHWNLPPVHVTKTVLKSSPRKSPNLSSSTTMNDLKTTSVATPCHPFHQSSSPPDEKMTSDQSSVSQSCPQPKESVRCYISKMITDN